ncbi:MAG: tRNA (adenosine(37)-N6)-dimethylallyltransferase MiaA [Desulfobulbaceae bacterium]|nr:tRNA (adenosine(37)-N6)-dimethylallyltransferase MiaA [Desulfobulbaceae bacterium]
MSKTVIEQPILVIVGPTAIGKTALSLEVSERHNCEIISVDSMQVYKHMDIGTAKVSTEERDLAVHHLIDIVEPNESYDAARFAEDSLACINEINNKNKIPLLTGGTGLYLKALFEGIFPEAPSDENIRSKLKKRLEEEGCDKLHQELSICDCVSAEKIHPNDTHRLLRALEIYLLTGKPWSDAIREHATDGNKYLFKNVLQIGLTCERSILYQRINNRCDIMLNSGLKEEVEGLLAMGFSSDLKSMQSIGYRHMNNYLSGEWTKEEMVRLLARDTRRYAKRQYTWFGKMANLQWQEVTEQTKILNTIKEWLS